MRIGVPREVKDGEYRVALSPQGVSSLSDVVVEAGAGLGAGFSDDEYAKAGAAIGDPWDCELVVKVKELQEAEYRRPRRGQTVFGFQHFGPDPGLLDAALASSATFVAYETVGQADGSLPILAPMSAIAGRLAVQVGAWCLQKQNGGSGVLLAGLEGIAPGRVAIFGAGNVGANALAVAHGMGAKVSVFTKTARRTKPLKSRYPHGAGRRRHRPGRHRRDLAPHLAQRADLPRGRRGPLLRAEHARGLRAHRQPGAGAGGIAFRLPAVEENP
jgi:alanine dehydrogenase